MLAMIFLNGILEIINSVENVVMVSQITYLAIVLNMIAILKILEKELEL